MNLVRGLGTRGTLPLHQCLSNANTKDKEQYISVLCERGREAFNKMGGMDNVNRKKWGHMMQYRAGNGSGMKIE